MGGGESLVGGGESIMVGGGESLVRGEVWSTGSAAGPEVELKPPDLLTLLSF